jgi:hypothetical protein
MGLTGLTGLTGLRQRVSRQWSVVSSRKEFDTNGANGANDSGLKMCQFFAIPSAVRDK